MFRLAQDNRFLPRHLTPEVAKNQSQWWHDRSYLITCVLRRPLLALIHIVHLGNST